MFSQPFHAANASVVECFWRVLADIRSQPAYRELVRSYNHGEFVE